MKVLIYDTECNSLDTVNGFIMEVAWAIFKVTPGDFLFGSKDSWRCLKAKSALVRWDRDYMVEPEAFNVTGLSNVLCETYGEQVISILPEIFIDMKECDFVGGHNIKGYDNDMFLSNQLRLFSEDSMALEIQEMMKGITFIDSFTDIDYPSHCKSLTLKYLALEHGYVLAGAHEALQDIFASAHLFAQYPIEKTIENAMQPIEKRFIKTYFGDPKIDVVKQHRFRWDPKDKIWFKNVRANKVEELHEALGFATDLFVTQGELTNGPF